MNKSNKKAPKYGKIIYDKSIVFCLKKHFSILNIGI